MSQTSQLIMSPDLYRLGPQWSSLTLYFSFIAPLGCLPLVLSEDVFEGAATYSELLQTDPEDKTLGTLGRGAISEVLIFWW